MLTCGQRALANVSYLESTRAKAKPNRDQTDQFYAGNLANFAPGLTFVSEKMAALDVVYRRLKEVGLGDFCLELHSNKANKKAVLDQLDSA